MESNLVQNLVNLKSLPETWAVKDFKEVVSDNSGGNKKLAKSNFLNEGEIAVVDQGKKLIAGYYNNTSLAVKTQPPYVVFGDHTRAFKYVDFPFIMGADGTKVLQPKKENCDTKYLYYFFLSINVPNTGYNRHFKYLKKLKIPIPPLDQQKKIATILDAADAYRQKTKALIEKYEELTQSLFLDMFGDPVTNPKGWEVSRLGDICDVRDGTHDSPKYVNDGYALVTSKNIKKGKLVLDDINYVSKDDYDKINKRSRVNKGDILMPMIGTIGNPLIVDMEVNFAIKNVALIKKSVKQIVNTEIIYFLLAGHYLQWYSSKNNKGGTQKFLSLGDIRKMPIIIPNDKLQNQFTERVQAIERQKAQAQASLAQAEDLFNSLLQRAFKGELTS